jgi:hypothetical protein
MGAILMVKSRCNDAARADEFNRWYDEVHVPDVLAASGVVAAQRYKLAGRPSKGEPTVEYLAIYEFGDDDPTAGMAGIQEQMAKIVPAGRMSELLEVISATTFTPLGARQKA